MVCSFRSEHPLYLVKLFKGSPNLVDGCHLNSPSCDNKSIHRSSADFSYE
jgi:hypothetical protein